MMDLLRSMRTFARVADEMSYTTAARSLDISPGSVSRTVSELERHLATRLFHRTTRQIALTHAGRLYLARCRAILDAIDDAEAEARSIRLHPTGRLKVQASPSLARHYLIPAAKAYQQMHPAIQVALTLSESTSHSIDEGFDIAILALPALRDSSLVGVRLGETYSVLCAAPAYLDAHAEPGSPAELATHAFVSGASTFTDCIELTLDGPDGGERTTARPALYVNSLASVTSALELGMGIGVLPLQVAIDALQSGRLVRILPHYRLDRLNIYALFASKHFLDAKVRTWLDHLKVSFAEMGTRQDAILRQLQRPGASDNHELVQVHVTP